MAWRNFGMLPKLPSKFSIWRTFSNFVSAACFNELEIVKQKTQTGDILNTKWNVSRLQQSCQNKRSLLLARSRCTNMVIFLHLSFVFNFRSITNSSFLSSVLLVYYTIGYMLVKQTAKLYPDVSQSQQEKYISTVHTIFPNLFYFQDLLEEE